MGARLAEMARIRLQYDETRQQVQDIQQVHMPRILPFTLEKRAISKLYIFRFGMMSRFQNCAQ